MKNAIVFPALDTPVKIEWLDSTSEPGWHYLKVGEKVEAEPRLQISRGVLMAISPTAVTIAGSISPRGPLDLTVAYLDPMTIPKGCITHVQVIP